MNNKKLNFKNCLFYIFLISLMFISVNKSLAASNYEVTIPDNGYYIGVTTNACDGKSTVRKLVTSNKGKDYYGCLYDSSVTNPKVTCNTGYEPVRLEVVNKLYSDSAKSVVYLCKSKYEYKAPFSKNESYAHVELNACGSSSGFIGRKLVAFSSDYSQARWACVYTKSAADFSPNVTCGKDYTVVRLNGQSFDNSRSDYIILTCQKKSSSSDGGGTTGGSDTGTQGGGSGSGQDKDQGGGTIVPNVDPNWHYTPSNPSQNYDSACSIEGTRKAVILIGKAIVLATYIVPFIIIILGMIDFGKAVTSNDEKASSKATGALIRRIVAGIVVFLIPTLLKAFINVININSLIYDRDNYNECLNCLMYPFNDCSPNKSESNTDK